MKKALCSEGFSYESIIHLIMLKAFGFYLISYQVRGADSTSITRLLKDKRHCTYNVTEKVYIHQTAIDIKKVSPKGELGCLMLFTVNEKAYIMIGKRAESN